MKSKTKKIFGPVTLLVLLVAFAGIWATIFLPSNEALEVTYMNVGQGDSAYLEFTDGKNALIDGGPDKKVLETLGRKMPFYRRKIDIVFLSHPHADHLIGLIHVLKRYEVGRVVMTGTLHTSPEYEEFLKLIKEKNIPVTKAVYGTRFDFGDNIVIKVLYPKDNIEKDNLNDTSQVLLLTNHEDNFLFMGDLEKDASSSMLALNPNLRTDVIKVPHHGSKDAFNENLYKQTSPKYAIISVGENKYGHPYAPLLDFLQASGIKTLRTDKDGDVEFVSAGSGTKLK